jgi:hypothetical protein
LPVEALRTLVQGLHRLLDLPFISFADYCAEDLLDPHRHLPAYPLLFGGCPVH